MATRGPKTKLKDAVIIGPFRFDRATATKLRKLAKQQQISMSEVLRNLVTEAK